MRNIRINLQLTVSNWRGSLSIALLIVLFFTSCSKKKVEIPQGVLSRQQMVPVLVDVHLAQAAAGLSNVADTVHYTMKDYLPYILTIHHINKAQYDSSISFYTSHPEIMQDIYDSVIAELSKKEGEIKTH